jgi:AhpD family alkylhydroperoxidase
MNALADAASKGSSMTPTQRIPLFNLAPRVLRAMVNLSYAVKQSSLGERLVELVYLRVSHVNGCGQGIDMHWRDLVKQGCDPRHLNTIAAWHESPFFSTRERAALAWADAMNELPHSDVTDAAWPQLREHFSEEEIAEVCYAVAAVRGWNTINVSLRSPIPEQPTPGM